MRNNNRQVPAVVGAEIPTTVITAAEWRALLTEDPQADPAWPVAWIERLQLAPPADPGGVLALED